MNSQLYESLYKNIKTPYLLLEKQNNKLIMLDVNDAFEEYFSLKREEIVNKNCKEIFDFGEIEFKKYYSYNNKYFFINFIEVSKTQLFYEFIDKTDKVKFIKKNEGLLGPLNDVVLEFNEDFTLRKVIAFESNKLYKNFQSLIGKKVADLYIPSITDHFMKSLLKAKNNSKPIKIEYDLKVGSESRWYQVEVEYVSRNDEKKYVAIIKDINDAKEKELKTNIHKKEDETEKHLRNVIFDLSTDLIFTKKTELSQMINYSLEKLGRHINADRAYIVEYFCEDGGQPKNTYEWVANGVVSEIDDFQTIDPSIIKLWDDFYKKNEILYIPNTSDLKESKLKEFLINREIKSLIGLPMMYKGECRGLLGFDYCHNYKEFSEIEKQIFTEFSSMLMGAFNVNYYEKALSDSEYKYRQITDNMIDVVWVVDVNLDLTFVTPSIYDLTGYTASEYASLPFNKRLTEDSVKRIMPIFREKLANFEKTKKVQKETIEAEIVKKDGSTVWVEYTVRFLIENEILVGLVGSTRNISIRKKGLEDLFFEKELFRTTLFSVADAVITTYKDGTITLMNQIASSLIGCSVEEAVGKNCRDVLSAYDSNNNRLCEVGFPVVFEQKKPLGPMDDVRLKNRKNEFIPIEIVATPILDKKEDVSGIVLVFRDITEKKKKEERILYLSYNDHLTTLNNRRYYEEQLRVYDSEANLPLSIIMIDVNGLKLINDAFGHLVGDTMLQKIAKILKDSCRKNDLIARVGGDEFALLLPNTNTKQAKDMITKIANKISQEKISSINLSISYGYETKTFKDEDIRDVFKEAESKMYKHKLSESQSMRYNTLEIIMRTLYEKSQTEEMHSKRVSKLCEQIGKAMELDNSAINELKTTGLMHDRKIIIPDEILNKTSTLTNDEWAIVKKHPETGYKILSSINEFASLAIGVLEHHEKWDGSGYPRKIRGKEISLTGRIVAVADAYDSMTNLRTYNVIKSKQAAITELKKKAGVHFDPEIVDIFINKVLKTG